jgi:hypothetical protein
MSSSIAQLLGQNKSVKKVKPGLFCQILICLSELNGRFRFSSQKKNTLLLLLFSP